jgi:hypothetical protein
MNEPDVLKELKSLILLKAGIRSMTPADCKTISIEISKTLNKNVSETTIKRLFGFAMVRHKFSRFTLTTLSEYVNNQTLISAIEQTENQTDLKGLNWKDTEEIARRITDFTIKSIKNRSGIPYEMTVNRKFSEHDFDDFYNSDHSFMAFISQPGYGKTIVLAHLAEKILAAKTTITQGTTLAFITAYNLLNKENTQINIETQLKSMLGISSSDTLINYVERNYNHNQKKLIIFLDGFSEIMLLRDTQSEILTGIIDFICAIENSKVIKLVMNMRSTTWTRFYDRIRGSNYLKKKWFPGNYFNLSDSSNVPPLTEKEVDLIIRKIDHIDYKTINPRLKRQLKFPFHVQLYYQLKEEDPEFNYSTNITFYELISRFIQDKIYKSNYYTEKILFLKKVIQLTDYGKKQNSVSKDDLISELSAFKNAYSELLSDGILMEERMLDSYHPKEYVRFIHPHIFEYFLFIELLEKFQLRVGDEYFRYIKEEYKSNHARFHILQWTLRFMVRTGNIDAIHNVFHLGLTRYEKNYLILFIAENLDYREKYAKEKLTGHQINLLHSAIANELTAFDFSDSCYREAIESLLKVATTEEHLLFYTSLLSIYNILELDVISLTAAEKQMHKCKAGNWNINPAAVISVALHKLKNSHDDDQILIERLEKNISPEPVDKLTIHDAVATILTMHCALLMNHPKGVTKLFEKLSLKFSNVIHNEEPFSKLFTSLASLTKEVFQAKYNSTSVDLNVPATHYIESIRKLTKAYQLYSENDYNKSLSYAIDCLEYFKKHSLKIISLMTYELIIQNFKSSYDNARQNEIMYERLCFAEHNNISLKLLNTTSDVVQLRR